MPVFGIEEEPLGRLEDVLLQLLILLQYRSEVSIEADDFEVLELLLPLVQQDQVVDFEWLPRTPREAFEDVLGQELQYHPSHEMGLFDHVPLFAAIVLVGQVELDAPDVLDSDVARREECGEAAILVASDIQVDLGYIVSIRQVLSS